MSTAATPVGEPSANAETREQALVPSAPALEAEPPFQAHAATARLPVEVDVAIPLRDFRVRNLLVLTPGTVVSTQWGHGDDVPLASRDVQLAWSEFEVAETKLAVRLTRLV